MKKITEIMKKIINPVGNFVKRHKVLTGFFIMILIAAFAGVHMISSAKNKREQSQAASVMTTSLSKMDLTSSVSVTGNLASIETKSVSTTLKDVQVEEVKVEVGDYVNAGDTVIVFDTEDLEYELETAQNSNALNNLKGDKSLSDAAEAVVDAQETYTEQVASLQQDVNTALSNYNTLREQADAAKTEYEKAVKAKEKAQKKYDKAAAAGDGNPADDEKEALTKAEEALTTAKKNYDDLETKAAEAYGNYYGRLNDQTEGNEKNAEQIEESEYNYKVTTMEQSNNRKTQTHQIQQLEEELGKAVVTAPIDGIITAVNVEAGDSYSGSTLFVIQDVSSFIVQAAVDEYDISDISKGLKAVVKTDATDDEEFAGTVTFVSPTPVSTSSEGQSGFTQASTSATYQIEIALDDYSDRLRIGMTAKTSIILDSVEDVFAVAYDCVHTDTEGNSYIEVLDNGTAAAADSGADMGEREGALKEPNPDENGEGGMPGAGMTPDGAKADIPDMENTENADSADGRNMPQKEFNQKNTKDSDGSSSVSTKRIYVEIGMESDYYTQIISDELYEGMQIVATASSGDKNGTDNMNFNFNMGGGMPDGGGNHGGGNRGGNMPGGF